LLFQTIESHGKLCRIKWLLQKISAAGAHSMQKQVGICASGERDDGHSSQEELLQIAGCFQRLFRVWIEIHHRYDGVRTSHVRQELRTVQGRDVFRKILMSHRPR